MRNCLILGSGRSGTSMAAGVLSRVGYFMGDCLCPGDQGNQKGYFEDLEINRLNEDLLNQVVPPRPQGIIGNVFFRSRPAYWQRWLAQLTVHTQIPCPSYLEARVRALMEREPFCFKDPRFCYTFPVWRRFAKNTVFLCVFRHPGITAHSLVNEAYRDCIIRHIPLHFNFQQAFQLWELMYRHILEIHYPAGGHWVFVHYNQFVDGSAFPLLEEQLGIAVYRDFVDAKLSQSKPIGVVPQSLSGCYQQLCNLAEYTPENSC